MSYFYLVWCNLRRKRLRTALTLLSIFVAFLLYGFLCTITQALTGGVEMAGADRLFTGHKTSMIETLPESYKARILRIPGVVAATHFTWFGGIYQDPKNFFSSMPVEPEGFLDMYREDLLPPDQLKKWLETRNGAVVGISTAKRFGWKIGDRVPLTSPIWGEPANQRAWEFEIVGIYTGAKKTTDTTQFLFRYDYFEEARTRNKGQVGWYAVRVRDPDQAAEVAKLVDAEFENSPYETKTQPEGAAMQGFAQQVGDIGTILVSILSAVFFTILLVVGNTMAQSVRERTEEIGVLKALGFSSGQVLALVLAESCLIAALGGFAGLGLAWFIAAQGSPVPAMLPIFYLPPRDVLAGAGLVFALGLAAGILPAWQAMRLQVAVALRRHA